MNEVKMLGKLRGSHRYVDEYRAGNGYKRSLRRETRLIEKRELARIIAEELNPDEEPA